MEDPRQAGRRWSASRTARAVVAGGLVTAALITAGCTGADSPGPTVRGATASTAPAADPTRRPAGTTPPTSTPAASTPVTGSPTVPPSADTPGTTVTVTRVVDGDTVRVSGGATVRLIGIDTPERGQCGFADATWALSGLVAGRRVTLVPGARDDTDRYGRLLRYVDVGGTDANLAMIRSGHAIARYDSRDGYGGHPREAAYVAADAASPAAGGCGTATVAPPSTVAPAPAAPAVGGGGTDPRFGTCGEALASGYGGYVRGVDPEYDWYRDADGDGVVCE